MDNVHELRIRTPPPDIEEGFYDDNEKRKDDDLLLIVGGTSLCIGGGLYLVYRIASPDILVWIVMVSMLIVLNLVKFSFGLVASR